MQYKAVVITSQVVEQHFLVYKISIPKCLYTCISIDAGNLARLYRANTIESIAGRKTISKPKVKSAPFTTQSNIS